MLGHILPLVKENESQVTLVPSIAGTSWLWMGLLQLSLWSCQLLASLNSSTQYGSLCSLVIKRFGMGQIFCFTAIESFLTNLSLGNYFILIESRLSHRSY